MDPENLGVTRYIHVGMRIYRLLRVVGRSSANMASQFNDFQPFNIVAKLSILYVYRGSVYSSA